jgi:hypothetical protein
METLAIIVSQNYTLLSRWAGRNDHDDELALHVAAQQAAATSEISCSASAPSQ